MSIPADANPADNDFWFVFEQPAPRRAIVVAEDAAGGPAARSWPPSISPDPALQCSAEVVAPSQLAGVDWDQVVAAALAGPAARGRRGRADPGVHRARRLGDLLPAAGARRRRALRRALDVLAGAEGGSPGRRAGGATGPARPHPERRAAAGRAAPGPASTAGSPASSRRWRRCAAGRRCWRGSTTDRGAAYFCATTPAAGDSSLATDGVVLYVLVQRALAAGAAVAGQHAAARGRRADRATIPPTGSASPAAEEALSTEYPFHRGVYPSGDRLLAVNRSAAEDSAPVLADRRVAELFRGLDFARVDDRAGSMRLADPGDLAACSWSP